MNSCFKNLKRRVLANSFWTSVLRVGSGQLIAQVISVITVPILSRIYNEAAYGDYALVLSTASLITNLSLFGLSSAIMKPSEEEESKKVFTAAFVLNLFICTTVTAGSVLFHRSFVLFSVTRDYVTTIVLMWIYMIVFNTSELLAIYVNRCGKYNKLFFNPLIGALTNLIIAVPLGFIGFGLYGFLISSIINYIVVCIYLYIGNSPFLKGFSFRNMMQVFSGYKEYVVFQYPANLTNSVAIEYPTQFLGRVFTTDLLGPYSMCLKVLKIPVRLIAAPISTVYFRTATELNRTGKDLAEFTYGFIHKVLMYSLVPIVICDLFAEEIFIFVLGPNWGEAGIMARMLSAQYALLFCSQCVSYCRVAIGKQKANLLYAVLHLLLVTSGCYLGYSLFHSLHGSVLVFSVFQSIDYIFDMALNFYYLDKRIMVKYIVEALVYSLIIYGIMFIKMI